MSRAAIRREFWGPWEDRSHLLKHHTNRAMVAAYRNRVLSVQVSHEPTAWGTVTHLWVRRHDDTPVIWRELQRVKAELVGPMRVGVEVFPPANEVVDTANMYHVWVLPDDFTLPFSLKGSPPQNGDENSTERQRDPR